MLAEEQARLKAEQQQQEADEDSDSEDSDSEEEGDTGAGEGSAVVKTAEEQEREARMMSTMYGDDVFTEDRPGEDSAKTGTGATAGKISAQYTLKAYGK